MVLIEAPNKTADKEFMVECTCHCSLLRFGIFDNKLYLEHYGWEYSRIKLSQGWEFSLIEARELLSKLKKRENTAFTSNKRFSHHRIRMRYKNETISFKWGREDEYEYLTISYYVNTKILNRRIDGWDTVIENKQIDSFIERLEQLVKELENN